jgi:CMP-N-acetylneuraminic acid synthetase
MEQLELKNKRIIDFYNDSNVVFWTRKLNVTHQQLSEAVLNTGSFYIEDIKKYLDKEKRIFSWYDLLSKKKGKN